jgi:hypothetical protein
MKPTLNRPATLVLVGVFALTWHIETARDGIAAQTRKPVVVTRLFTGPDGQTHAEDTELTFKAGANSDVAAMLPVTGAELHRQPPNQFIDWHPGPRRQYVITLSGRGEIEVADGKKISLEPGHISLIEDTTGKGHITKSLGAEDRITLWLPLADQGGR